MHLWPTYYTMTCAKAERGTFCRILKYDCAKNRRGSRDVGPVDHSIPTSKTNLWTRWQQFKKTGTVGHNNRDETTKSGTENLLTLHARQLYGPKAQILRVQFPALRIRRAAQHILFQKTTLLYNNDTGVVQKRHNCGNRETIGTQEVQDEKNCARRPFQFHSQMLEANMWARNWTIRSKFNWTAGYLHIQIETKKLGPTCTLYSGVFLQPVQNDT